MTRDGLTAPVESLNMQFCRNVVEYFR